MATKTITIMEDAYGALKNSKKNNESFSDTIRRLTAVDNPIINFFGVWDDELGEKVKKEIEKEKELQRKITIEREKRLFA